MVACCDPSVPTVAVIRLVGDDVSGPAAAVALVEQ
jgi:hypothetical protein